MISYDLGRAKIHPHVLSTSLYTLLRLRAGAKTKLDTLCPPQFLPAAQTASRRLNAALRMQTLGPCFHKWSRSAQDARRPRAYVLTCFLDIPLETLLSTSRFRLTAYCDNPPPAKVFRRLRSVEKGSTDRLLSAMISGVLLFNQKGENLIFRQFRNDCTVVFLLECCLRLC